MHTKSFLGVVITITIFLHGVPAPPIVVGAIIPLVVTGGSYGIVAASIADEAKRKDTKDREFEKPAIVRPARMVRKVAAKMERTPDGPGLAPPGVPQFNWDSCFHEARQSQIVVEGPVGNHGIRAIGLPPVCMNLAVVLGGDVNGTATPIPCGSDCMDWVNMTPGNHDGVRHMINSKLLEKK
ncbi:hypothetical protein CkaCkLH20_03195 [Colletotrichum karsti]|uniref:Uncharacterized protein n=1 Tax=Colletotrichum karsti TaxID=1095194 RepID=A0A9P6IC49_9PEZI|nr:uncharacterized protein CkaCkLH20_03195 [Colletotrichum karsti]KAF9879652.1 hypothetical protein CkaCkLH20_03195 [Colletotrichum karsti]